MYVGDSVVDAETARRAGVPFTAVLSGVMPRDAFDGYNGDRFLEYLQELTEEDESHILVLLMRRPGDAAIEHDDPYNLNRFLTAQESVYDRALAELKSGRKRTHWMWFIFPQIDGLGHSETARFYAIKNLEEARAYLRHPILGARLAECAEAVLAVEGRTAAEIFGYPDDLKLRSSMTLFASVSEPGSVFERVLAKYYHGER